MQNSTPITVIWSKSQPEESQPEEFQYGGRLFLQTGSSSKLRIFATDGQTNGQTDGQPNTLSRSRCRERRLNNTTVHKAMYDCYANKLLLLLLLVPEP